MSAGSLESAVYSTLADDPDFSEILEYFAGSLAKQVPALQQARAAGAWGEVQGLAHQLAGSGGGYGFPELTSLAREVESACREEDRAAAWTAVEQLCAFIARIRFPA